jgi:cyclopropane-fatty-acyl-phospholipid synthase
MVYSCAYFPNGDETLDAAQEAKLDLICRKLALVPGDRLLDIGCGWGALVIFAAQRYGVSALGVTLSEAQRQEARERVAAAGIADRVRIELLDYRDLRGEFDKIASVGMSEHVGRERLGDYFRTAWERLAPGGLMLEHAITRGPSGNDDRSGSVISGEFSRRYVFPDGEILPLGEKMQAAEALGFEVRDVENLREHYATTLRHWVRNLEAHGDRAEREVGPERTRLWRLFMSAAAHQFVVGQIAIHQALLAKPDRRGHVGLPRSRAALYRT